MASELRHRTVALFRLKGGIFPLILEEKNLIQPQTPVNFISISCNRSEKILQAIKKLYQYLVIHIVVGYEVFPFV